MSLHDMTSWEHSLSVELRTAATVYRDSGLDVLFLASQQQFVSFECLPNLV